MYFPDPYLGKWELALDLIVVLLYIVRGVTNCYINILYTKILKLHSQGARPLYCLILNFNIYYDKNVMHMRSLLLSLLNAVRLLI